MDPSLVTESQPKSRSNAHLETIVSYPFAENTYVMHLDGHKDCVVFDPGLEPDRIIAYLRENNLEPEAILITHAHADHIGGNAALKKLWPECPLVVGHAEAEKLTDAHLNLSAQFGEGVVSPPADVLVREGDRYDAAGFAFDVLETPGHSSGHVVFVCKDHEPAIVFGGDVLFAGGIGRVDFPGCSFEQLSESIHAKLFTLPDDTVVCSGHGPVTTIGREKRTNPWVGEGADPSHLGF